MPTEDQFRRMVSEATDQAARSALYRARRDGDLKIDDEVPLAPIPTHCGTAPPVEMTKDKLGRTNFKAVEPPAAHVEPRGEVNMDRFRSQMKVIEDFNEEDKKKAIKAIYLEHLGVAI